MGDTRGVVHLLGSDSLPLRPHSLEARHHTWRLHPLVQAQVQLAEVALVVDDPNGHLWAGWAGRLVWKAMASRMPPPSRPREPEEERCRSTL